MRNFLGNQFYIGQFVAYPGREGSNLWMNFGVVYKTNCEKQESHISKLGIISVRMKNKNSDWTTEYNYSQLALNPEKDIILKKVLVEPHRIVIMDEQWIPYSIYTLLNEEVKNYKPENI